MHDAVACVLEFLEENRGMERLLVSMDVEGGFDKLDRGLLLDFLAARGSPPDLTAWIARWCENRVVRFRFNGRISRDYHISRGVPQGSPLSPFLFGAYVADVMTPRLRYGPAIRVVVISYVDDVIIAVAADSRSLAKYLAAEVFDDCCVKAAARNLGFSAIKTEWIGFGDEPWDAMNLGGNALLPSDIMRVLGYRFNHQLNWSAHVDYWLKRGLWVRNRISAISRRFGDVDGTGAWETYRLFQGVYLPTVYFGLEFVGDFGHYVRRIQVHVNDTLRHLFRLPFKLANNILLAEFGTPPVHIQARYLQRRCYARMITYRFGDRFQWFGVIRDGWAVDGFVADVTDSDVPTNVPDTEIIRGKDLAIARHDVLWEEYMDMDVHVIYTDGSSSEGKSGAGWVCYDRGLRMDPGSDGLPGGWCALECEIWAVFRALSLLEDRLPSVVFTDCLPVVEILGMLGSVGRNHGLAVMFAPVLERIGAVKLFWIPGHMGVGGNELVDKAAKAGRCKEVVRGACDVRMGVGNDLLARKMRSEEWLGWHRGQGHDYYGRLPRSPRHLRGLLRWDAYVLVRLRSGTGARVGHEDCDGVEDRFHMVKCPLYLAQRPSFSTLYDDRKVKEWVDWWKRHDYLGMHVVHHKSSIDGIKVVGGNPFDDTGRVSICGGPTIPARFIKPATQCDVCGKTSMGVHRCRPNRPRRGEFDFISPDYRGSCYVCGVVMSRAVDHGAFRVGIGKHLKGSERCWRIWRGHELVKVFGRFADMSDLDARMTVLYHIPIGTLRCVCGRLYGSGGALSRHVEEHEDCLMVWRTRYVRDMEVLEEEILRERVMEDPALDMGADEQEDALIREGTGSPERP